MLISKIWKLNIPPKLKLFWWKVLHNGLPVAENLNRRGMKIYNLCQVCGEEVETVQHVIMDCRVAKEIWSFTLGKAPEFQLSDTALMNFLQDLLDKHRADPKNLLPFLQVGEFGKCATS